MDPYDLDRLYGERPSYYAHSPSPYHTPTSQVDYYVEQVAMQVGIAVVYSSAAVLLVQLLHTVSEYFTRRWYMCNYGRRYRVFERVWYSLQDIVLYVEDFFAQSDPKQMIEGRVGPMTDIVFNAIEEVATKWESPGP